ncbi:hypothetical protein H4Q31_04920 [Cohnella lubricantis]|uniref:Beta-xylosidase C-terminal Concanavalin A-like domain-containing protein n=1 Tax=Cohnella lubricantis TaxID=2163172 RepID=A0A841TBA5_9BACL|nr:hypothetical protein [Cohnella lubricantis]
METTVENLPYDRSRIYLRIRFNFLDSTLDHFMGCRIGLFHYAAKDIGGVADFDYFHYERMDEREGCY